MSAKRSNRVTPIETKARIRKEFRLLLSMEISLYFPKDSAK